MSAGLGHRPIPIIMANKELIIIEAIKVHRHDPNLKIQSSLTQSKSKDPLPNDLN